VSSSTQFTSGEPPARPVGRRPGNPGTRESIVAAARAAFAEQGYEAASLRAIARRAGVDPALVHHYFDGKPDLFVEVLHLATDPRVIAARIKELGQGRGTDLARAFLDLWERPRADGRSPFVGLVEAVSASQQASDGLREFIADRVWSFVGSGLDPAETAMRHCFIASQLFGLAWVRYILRLEPFASATVDDLASWVGPALDRALDGPLPSQAVDDREI
jgi:AcrR family transcriptional regulator